MPKDSLIQLVSDVSSLIVLPWVIWVTVSIFNQRQELALIRQILESLTERKT